MVKKQKGGLFDRSKTVKPVQSIKYDLDNLQLVGEGGFGVVAMLNLPSEKLAIKFIKTTSLCRSAQMEATIHNEVYQSFIELGSLVPDGHVPDGNVPQYPVYQILHIPKPLAFTTIKPTELKIGSRLFTTSCYYVMEYMEPINIGANLYEGQPIQLHVVATKSPTLLPDDPYRGYFIGVGQLDNLLNHLKEIYPNISRPISSRQIFEAIGIACGCAIFGSGYNPKDFQFMISRYDNQFKLIAFDFGMFEKIDNYHHDIMDAISDDLMYSPYIGLHMTDDIDSAFRFLLGMATTVKPLIKLYGANCPEQTGFLFIVNYFIDNLIGLGQYYDRITQHLSKI